MTVEILTACIGYCRRYLPGIFNVLSLWVKERSWARSHAERDPSGPGWVSTTWEARARGAQESKCSGASQTCKRYGHFGNFAIVEALVPIFRRWRLRAWQAWHLDWPQQPTAITRGSQRLSGKAYFSAGCVRQLHHAVLHAHKARTFAYSSVSLHPVIPSASSGPLYRARHCPSSYEVPSSLAVGRRAGFLPAFDPWQPRVLRWHPLGAGTLTHLKLSSRRGD